MAVFRFFKMAAVHHLEFVIRLLNTSTTEKKLKSTKIAQFLSVVEF